MAYSDVWPSGEFCALCDVEHYEDGGFCLPCDPDAQVALYINAVFLRKVVD